MKYRRYYSVRTGKNSAAAKYELPILLRLFNDLVKKFEGNGYFQEAFGYDCVDRGLVPGTFGGDIEAQIFRRLRKPNLWPVWKNFENYSEDDVFDLAEILFDNVSKPLEGDYHSWSDCGWHYYKFDQQEGREEFRTEINEILGDYKEGFSLSLNGEVVALADSGLEYLIEAEIPDQDVDNIKKRIDTAVRKFRRHRSSIEDRRDAVRDLADVLEFIRPKLKKVLTKTDESDLFNIANNFGIRHHNADQKTNYDPAIWLSWMFYFYLATIHAALRLIDKSERDRQDL